MRRSKSRFSDTLRPGRKGLVVNGDFVINGDIVGHDKTTSNVAGGASLAEINRYQATRPSGQTMACIARLMARNPVVLLALWRSLRSGIFAAYKFLHGTRFKALRSSSWRILRWCKFNQVTGQDVVLYGGAANSQSFVDPAKNREQRGTSNTRKPTRAPHRHRFPMDSKVIEVQCAITT